VSEKIDLNETSIDDLARLVSRIYDGVSLSDDPTFRWLNVFTDVTILGEEIRRGESRQHDAVKRAMSIKEIGDSPTFLQKFSKLLRT
jgi:hypothetical protein